jgi:predicted amidohydrolase
MNSNPDKQYKDVIKVACVNFMAVLGDKDANLEKMTAYIKELSGQGADMVVFPEMSVSGYEVDAHSLAELIPGPATERLEQAARENGIYVIAGMPERDKTNAESVYNTAVIFGPEGMLGSYRKMHPFGPELEWAKPGEELPIWETNFGPIGIAICFDHYVFPEAPRAYAVKGCRLLINPSAAGHFEGITDVPEAVMTQLKARVIENMVFMVSANTVGVQNPTDFFGQSVILGPKPGSVAYQVYAGPASEKEEEVIMAELDLSLANQFGYMDQRHASCYSSLSASA